MYATVRLCLIYKRDIEMDSKAKINRDINKTFFWSLVNPKCQICGYDKHVWNLQSHHLIKNSKWDKTDSLGAWLSMTRYRMLENITTTKFAILCKICHTDVHEMLKNGEIVNLIPINTKVFLMERFRLEKEVPCRENRKRIVKKKNELKEVISPPPPDMERLKKLAELRKKSKGNPEDHLIQACDIGLFEKEDIDEFNEMNYLFELKAKKKEVGIDKYIYDIIVPKKYHSLLNDSQRLILREIDMFNYNIFAKGLIERREARKLKQSLLEQGIT